MILFVVLILLFVIAVGYFVGLAICKESYRELKKMQPIDEKNYKEMINLKNINQYSKEELYNNLVKFMKLNSASEAVINKQNELINDQDKMISFLKEKINKQQNIIERYQKLCDKSLNIIRPVTLGGDVRDGQM